MAFFKHLDELSDITDITFYDRKRLGPLDKASEQIMRGDSSFSAAERELMAAYVSGLNSCQFCFGSHAAVAKQFGISESTISLLIENIETAPIKEQLKPIFHYLNKLTLSPAKLTQSDFDAIIDAGHTEQAVQDVILVGCLFNFYNRLLDGHGVKGNQAIYALGGSHLYKNGYSVPWFIGYVKNILKQKKRKKLKQIQS